MQKIHSIFINRLLSASIAIVMLTGYPLGAVAFAEPDAGSTGPATPTGAEASSYTYNESTGLWENDYYTWNPITKQTSPKSPTTYSYNPSTSMWDTTEWIWDAPSQKYVPNTVTAEVAPASASVNSIENTGPDSDNAIAQTENNSGTFDLFYNASISNTSTSQAKSGNASVASNTLAGNSTSGDASSIANIINLLQSNWDPQGANSPLLFNANINGDVTGDLVLDPNLINTTGPGSSAEIDSQRTNNLTINYDANGVITNDITLEAISGDSTVNGNTEAGNATTGDARVVANIINMLNSAINTGKSFIGSLNINGNFNGDILLPPNFLDQLIASSGPNSTVNLSNTVNNDIVANIDNSQTISNNTNLNAASGSADVTGNTSGGSATTGKAETELNVLNLTGKQVIDANTLLVFVNVLGQWVGMLVNAPSGSNSAAFCGGDCQISSLVDNNVDINAQSNFAITNNLDLDALSGNALVSGNTKAGNAASGNASASVNIANILGSQLRSTDWLGILFINVNGIWNGSFGINSLAAAQGSNQPSKTTATDSRGGIPAWLIGVVAATVTVALFSLGAATELYDKLWAARVTRASNRKSSSNLSLPIKKWLRGLSWKLPLF